MTLSGDPTESPPLVRVRAIEVLALAARKGDPGGRARVSRVEGSCCSEHGIRTLSHSASIRPSWLVSCVWGVAIRTRVAADYYLVFFTDTYPMRGWRLEVRIVEDV